MNLDNIRISKIKAAVKRAGYKFFNEGDYNLNLIGLRSSNTNANEFNDLLCVLFSINSVQQLLVFNFTSDPGVYYRENPLNVDGTAIVAPGQYPGLWQLGNHQSRYRALIQAGQVSVYRDNDKDGDIDMQPGRLQTGHFGINCHRAHASGFNNQVDKWSAGCQVLADPLEFDILMALCERAAKTWGNSFTYTLLDEGQL